MPHKKAHLFICVNGGPDRPGTCANRGSVDLHGKVKELCKAQSWAGEVRINRSHCLGQCEKGIASVLYPQDHWMLNLTTTDSQLLFDAVEAAVETSVLSTADVTPNTDPIGGKGSA